MCRQVKDVQRTTCQILWAHIRARPYSRQAQEKSIWEINLIRWCMCSGLKQTIKKEVTCNYGLVIKNPEKTKATVHYLDVQWTFTTDSQYFSELTVWQSTMKMQYSYCTFRPELYVERQTWIWLFRVVSQQGQTLLRPWHQIPTENYRRIHRGRCLKGVSECCRYRT